MAVTRNPTLTDRFQATLARGLMGLAMLLPYDRRVWLAGRLFSRLVAPLTGWRKRIRRNLAHAWPDLPEVEVERIVDGVPDNVGRMLIETWSGEEFARRIADTAFEGPGLAAFEAARAAERPVVLITAHFGNYESLRATLVRRGHDVGGLYKPMSNPIFNASYVERLTEIGPSLYTTSGRGIAGLLKRLSGGGIIGIVTDVASRKAPVLSYFGRPAHTPLSAAEWALKYDAVMIPVFGVRLDDGLSFRLEFKDPIEGETAVEMMQKMNDVTEEMARTYPDQWFWIHNRWKSHGDA